ncbi:MAG: hypothetical protein A2Z38_10675 [Planctomycetes bacterium RBG_19FT_COMBO_48_8]|nr:MAG: hypothetical protein A2Z38_10675 [Planctomycetes bacterium RBG_19FT_COMBO_48_8]
MICRMRFEKTKPISKRLKLMQLFIEQGIMAKNELSGGEKTKPIKANLPTPKGVDRRLDDDCIRDIVVCGKEIWYKAYVARSTGIFR